MKALIALLLACLCMIVWSAWPLIAKISKMPAATISVVVSGATFTTSLIWFLIKGSTQTLTNTSGISVLALAGFINGIGFIAYGFLTSADSKLNVSTYVAIISAGVAVMAVVMAGLAFKYGFVWGEALSLKKISLIGIIGICTYMLLRK